MSDSATDAELIARYNKDFGGSLFTRIKDTDKIAFIRGLDRQAQELGVSADTITTYLKNEFPNQSISQKKTTYESLTKATIEDYDQTLQAFKIAEPNIQQVIDFKTMKRGLKLRELYKYKRPTANLPYTDTSTYLDTLASNIILANPKDLGFVSKYFSYRQTNTLEFLNGDQGFIKYLNDLLLLSSNIRNGLSLGKIKADYKKAISAAAGGGGGGGGGEGGAAIAKIESIIPSAPPLEESLSSLVRENAALYQTFVGQFTQEQQQFIIGSLMRSSGSFANPIDSANLSTEETAFLEQVMSEEAKIREDMKSNLEERLGTNAVQIQEAGDKQGYNLEELLNAIMTKTKISEQEAFEQIGAQVGAKMAEAGQSFEEVVGQVLRETLQTLS